MRAIIFLLSIIVITTSSCKNGMGKRVKGNGHTSTSTKTPGNFSRVEQKGSFDVVLKTGAECKVEIDAEDNITEHIETYVDNNTLVIRSKDGFNLRPTRDIRITVTAPVYTGIWSYGSGDISSESVLSDSSSMEVGTRGSGDISLKLNVPEIKAESVGSGNIELSGDTREISIECTGSGDLRADDLKAETVHVDIRGSGNASVNASKALTLEIKGSGDVTYRGNPSIQSNIKGSGSINKAD